MAHHVAKREKGSPRMKFRILVVLLAVLAAGASRSDEYPSRPIRLIVPYTPGGPADIVARLLGQRLGEAIGTTVIVDNRGGANGIIGTELAARAAPDGYTLLFGTIQTHGVNPSLFAKLSYDPVKDFAPVAPATTFPFLLAVTPTLPASSVANFIALAKAKPGTLNYSSAGTGTGTHLAGELLKSMAQIDITHVPYKGGGDALTDVIAGRIEMTFVGVPAALPFIKAGSLKALAISGTRRLTELPDVPTVAETLPGFDVSSWNGFFAPVGTPVPIIKRLNEQIGRIVLLPEIKDRLMTLGAEPMTATPEQFGTFVREEIAKWRNVVKTANIKTE
jgi:tripartite-type tricarboxylate transporter receptor subunit TctC